jgi:hypothetical protein
MIAAGERSCLAMKFSRSGASHSQAAAPASDLENSAGAKDFGEIHRRLDLAQCRLPAFGARAQSADGGCRGLPVSDEHVDSIRNQLFAELELLQNIFEGVAHVEHLSESGAGKSGSDS